MHTIVVPFPESHKKDSPMKMFMGIYHTFMRTFPLEHFQEMSASLTCKTFPRLLGIFPFLSLIKDNLHIQLSRREMLEIFCILFVKLYTEILIEDTLLNDMAYYFSFPLIYSKKLLPKQRFLTKKSNKQFLKNKRAANNEIYIKFSTYIFKVSGRPNTTGRITPELSFLGAVNFVEILVVVCDTGCAILPTAFSAAAVVTMPVATSF